MTQRPDERQRHPAPIRRTNPSSGFPSDHAERNAAPARSAPRAAPCQSFDALRTLWQRFAEGQKWGVKPVGGTDGGGSAENSGNAGGEGPFLPRPAAAVRSMGGPLPGRRTGPISTYPYRAVGSPRRPRRRVATRQKVIWMRKLRRHRWGSRAIYKTTRNRAFFGVVETAFHVVKKHPARRTRAGFPRF